MGNNSEYEKMPKNLKAYNLTEKETSDLAKLKWVVTEKVHGANFSFVYEHNKLLFAKRKDYLSWTDDFFGFQLVVHKIEDNILQLFEQLRLTVRADRYIIYGELFGGHYPHPDIAPCANVQAIQTGVYYSPDIHFCAFDIAVESADNKHYLDYKTSLALFEQYELLHAAPLFTGKWTDAINFDTRIPSGIPALLGHPVLADNIIEGIVVKPYSHSELDKNFRPVIKIKNREFDEETRFHEAEKWSYIPEVNSAYNDLAYIVDDMNNYINRNRLDSVLSKTGRIDIGNTQRMEDIQAEFVHDIVVDFNINNDGILDALAESQREWIAKRLNAHIAAYIDLVSAS